MFHSQLARRRFLSNLAIGAGAGAFAACGLRRDGVLSALGPRAASGSLFTGTIANNFADLDPTIDPTAGGAMLNSIIYERLYRPDPHDITGALTPELAGEMPKEVSPTTYRVRLRDGVTFHDGEPMTADDVVFTIERIKDPDTASLFGRIFTLVDTVHVVDDHEIELTLTSPTTLLTERLALVRVLSRAAVAASADALKLKPVGTGPYRVVSAVSDQIVQLARFDGYTGDRELLYDELEITFVPDGNARVAALRSGDSKVIEDVPASAYDSLASQSDLSVDAVPGYAHSWLFFHCGKPPFDDVRVRQAVLYAIDRDTITEVAFFGHAESAWAAGELRADDPEYAEPDTIYRYDPDHARSLLADAGYGDGSIAIDLLLTNDVDYLFSQGPIIEQNLRDVGFDVNVIPGANLGLYNRVSAGDYNLFLAWGNPAVLAADAEFRLRWIFYGSVPRTMLFWEGDALLEVERLLDEALSAADGDGRRSALAAVQKIVHDETPIATLHFKDQLTGWSSDLQGYRPLPTTGLYLDGVTG